MLNHPVLQHQFEIPDHQIPHSIRRPTPAHDIGMPRIKEVRHADNERAPPHLSAAMLTGSLKAVGQPPLSPRSARGYSKDITV